MKQNLEQAVQQELSKAKVEASQVEVLFLDEKCFTKDLVGLSDLTGLKILSLNNVGLQSLNGVEKLTNLIQLSVSDNKISGGLEYLLALKNLQELDICNNKISSQEELLSLKNIPNLQVLDVESCPVSSTPQLREKVFAEFKELVFLNGTDKDGKEREELYQDEDDQEGEDDDDDLDEYDEEDDSEVEEEEEEGAGEQDDEEGGEEEEEDEEDDSQQDEQETTINAKRPLEKDIQSEPPSKQARIQNNQTGKGQQ
eukprot:TRINITY_DN6809_c1_g1_i1.p1 TRINITY_DN6809_c1_g1~~TRINITY_DN6809_c1_g1_i1.p1  ORF type:complete len:255 (-),score=77.74 TRINITY_DN6809_c1_g1_i1:328-1092(-)